MRVEPQPLTMKEARTRLVSLREARDAGRGWHDITNLWSIEHDLDWLLAVTEALWEPADNAARVLDLWLTGDEDFTEKRVRDAIDRVRAAFAAVPA